MPAIPDAVFFASASEINAKLRAREFSCEELTRAWCDRLERIGPRYNALALSLREIAIRQAKEVDYDLKRERFRGPLQGVPFGAKDLLSVAGQPTAWGAKPFAGQVFPESATVIEKLRKTGAVCIGKLGMVELAGGGGYRYPAASLTGPGLNPWDRSRWSGGSSSGSGSAVAAGLVGWALGSETSGSILTPAAYCGVTGLRPTYGLVSRAGAMALSWTLDKIGPMARTAEDCGHILRVIAGGDAKDPGSAGKSFYYSPQYARPLKDIRVVYHPVDFEGWADPAARADFRAAIGVVRDLGVQLIEAPQAKLRLPDYPIGPTLSAILGAEAASIFQDILEDGRVDQLADAKQIAGLKSYLQIRAVDYLKAMRIRRLIQDDFEKLFTETDFILAPSRTGPASRVSEALDARSTRTDLPKEPGFNGLIPAGNLAGLPALSLPCGFADGLPIAIQLVGRPFSENQLLAMGRAFQQRTDFHRRRPKVD